MLRSLRTLRMTKCDQCKKYKGAFDSMQKRGRPLGNFFDKFNLKQPGCLDFSFLLILS